METAVIVCTVLLALATVGTLHRLARGPALLDRATTSATGSGAGCAP